MDGMIRGIPTLESSSSLPASPASSSSPSSQPELHVHVVYIEGDERLGKQTARYLESHNLSVALASNGAEGIALVMRERPDIVLLDALLPTTTNGTNATNATNGMNAMNAANATIGMNATNATNGTNGTNATNATNGTNGMNGFDVCQQLRTRIDAPILMVSARDEESDRILGLEGGADDYILKPFSPRELLARIRAHARRARGQIGPARELRVGPIVIDRAAMRATFRSEPLVLTTYEFLLLRTLAERAGRVVKREQVVDAVRGSADEAFDRSVDIHISHLRAKLGDDPRNPRLIKTVRGAGYMLAEVDE